MTYAVCNSVSVPMGRPVLGLRLKRGKLLLEISSRILYPVLKTLLVLLRSMTYSQVSCFFPVIGADNAVLDVAGVAARTDAHQLGGGIGAGRAGGGPQMHL